MKIETGGLPSFQQYQLAFTAHLRNPSTQPRPKNVPIERMAIYKEIVFNNIFESVSACFPVAQQVLGKRLWLKLVKTFLREHAASSPIFREIPEEFLNFLMHAPSDIQQLLPPYLISLCHYEWIELLVATIPVSSVASTEKINRHGPLMSSRPAFTPTMQLLHYDYAVHQISRKNKPRQPASTELLVYRNQEDEVKFVALNPVTYRLILLLQKNPVTCKEALTSLATELNHPQPDTILQFGQAILEELKSQGIILGTLTDK